MFKKKLIVSCILDQNRTRLIRIFTDVEERLRMGVNTEEMVEEEEVGCNDDLISSLYFTQDQQKRVDFILGNSLDLFLLHFLFLIVCQKNTVCLI